MAEYRTLSYRYVDPEAALKYFSVLRRRGLLKWRFPDTPWLSPEEALAVMIAPGSQLFFALNAQDEVMADIGLTNWNGLSAVANLGIHPAIHGREARRMGRKTLYQLRHHWTREDGTPLVRTLLAFVGKANRLSMRFCVDMGFKPVIVIPQSVKNVTTGEFDDGTLLALDLDTIKEDNT